MKFIALVGVVFMLFRCSGEGSTEQIEEQEVEIIIDSNEVIPTTSLNESESNEEPVLESEEEEWLTGCLTNVDAYLNDPGEEYTNIRNGPSGDIIMQLPWGQVEQEYMITIIESLDGWFKIEETILGLEEDFEIPGGIGWVHPSVVATDTRNYGNQSINLYESPDETGELTGTIDQESGGLKVLNACRGWVLIELAYDDYYRKGWMKTEWCCGNPLTTCS